MLRAAQREVARSLAAHAGARQRWLQRRARLRRRFAATPARVLGAAAVAGAAGGRWLRLPAFASGLWRPWLARAFDALIRRALRP